MDYIHAQSDTPPDVHGQMQTILTLLYSEGYMFLVICKSQIFFAMQMVKSSWLISTGVDGMIWTFVMKNSCNPYRTKSMRTWIISRLEMGRMHIIRCQCPCWKVCGPLVWNLLHRFGLNTTGWCLISSCGSRGAHNISVSDTYLHIILWLSKDVADLSDEQG